MDLIENRKHREPLANQGTLSQEKCPEDLISTLILMP